MFSTNSILEKIHKAGLKFLIPLTPWETYRTIVHEAMKLVNGESGSIILEINGQLQTVYEVILNYPTFIRRKRGFAYRAFNKRQAFTIHTNELKKVHPQLVRAGVKSIVFIPLAYKNKSIGILVVRSHESGYFNHNEPKVLQLFGSMASLAIRKTQLYDEARKALEDRDLFLSMAAHEFRTPLTTIGGYAKLLADKLSEKNTEAKWAAEMYWEVGRLSSLVNELLETSRIQTGKFTYTFREYNLKDIVKKAITEFQFINRKILFRDDLKDTSGKIIGDFEKLLQMTTNLIDNAAKFSDPTTKIVVTLKAKTPFFILTVSDQGKGIPNEDLPRIFEGFYRGRKTSEKGMGLGLFLAKNIVNAHHGSIKIHSKIGKGTLVEVKLPGVKIW